MYYEKQKTTTTTASTNESTAIFLCKNSSSAFQYDIAYVYNKVQAKHTHVEVENVRGLVLKSYRMEKMC